jgi:hypothetical protein
MEMEVSLQEEEDLEDHLEETEVVVSNLEAASEIEVALAIAAVVASAIVDVVASAIAAVVACAVAVEAPVEELE